ncbi:MAG: bifunctional oligoribonuclease/PAP phosphatase NrnA [Desulfuromonadaceae bacterium]|nr:bifunctional oligoribonuclease/PAP phosphatase NrnA [Desulfuromonadaceae bacterium]MDD2855143.1 bifunctional oligoribonuclease/PAP phosphatase NrnA [Desulfuromonadaceae bacterium]
MMEIIQQIIEVIRADKSFLITTHEGPDGDAIGSSLALASFLRKLGKSVTVHYQDPVPDLYAFLPGADSVLSYIPEQHYDVAFVLDIGERRRAGEEFCAFTDVTTTINLDHHLSCEKFGDYNLIDSSAAATGLLVYRIANAFGYKFDPETALCIYVATITDTGSFRYSNSNREAFTVAGEMIECGVNAWYVAEKLYENQPRRRLELLAKCLPTLDVFKDGLAASIVVTLDMYEACGAGAELTDGFVNYPRSISGVEVAIFFRQLEETKFKVGFRSKGKVNVAAFSAALGGGGHHNAAGCTLSGSIGEVKRIVYEIVEASL